MSSSATRQLPTICILAGGLGTRLGSLTRETPKPLIEVAGEPFLRHQLRLLADNGARHVVLCVGHLGELIEHEIGHESEGLRVDYSYDSPQLDGTLGAIRRALPLLGRRFLVLYGDTYLDINYLDVVDDWQTSGAIATMTVLHNRGRWQQSNAVLQDHLVTCYDKFHPDPSMEWIDYGLGGLSAEVIEHAEPEHTDLADLYSKLALDGLLRGYVADNPFHEIGTPERLEETDRFLRARINEPNTRPPVRNRVRQ